VTTYARSLLNYTDETIEFLPLRGSAEGRDRLQVSSIIKGSSRGPMRLDYRLINDGGNWRVYDIIIEGVSLMQGYRAQFSEVAKQGGVNAVLEKMRKHNSR
jgi:phospholipid transport system substrate-binding protein